MSDVKDFVIKNGKLEKYTGTDRSVEIPEGVTSIEYHAFVNCAGLTSLTIPASVKHINGYSFSASKNLKEIHIPSLDAWLSIEMYGDSPLKTGATLFIGGRIAETISIPEGTTSIGRNAFYGCKSLKSVTIPEGVTTINENAFAGCSNLTRVTVPKSLTSIAYNAFGNCLSLKEVYAHDLESWLAIGMSSNPLGNGAALYIDGRKVESMNIPADTEKIGFKAFLGCDSLTDVTIPECVTNISEYAFADCNSLKSITILGGEVYVAGNAFQSCNKLDHLSVPQKSFKIKEKVFGDSLPNSLIPEIGTFYRCFQDNILQHYILNSKVWEQLPQELQAEIFLSRQSKSLTKAYVSCIKRNAVERLGEGILARLKSDVTAKECDGAAGYMLMFSSNVPKELMQHLYQALKNQKNGAKAVQTISGSPELSALIPESAETDADAPDPTVDPMTSLMLTHKATAKGVELKLKEYYAMKPEDMPAVLSREGKAVPPIFVAWLLTIHEIGTYGKGIHKLRPEAAEAVALLDRKSLQEALLSLSNHLDKYVKSKKKNLAYPICRYADEATMKELTKRAPAWRTTVSGNDASPLREFRMAICYSDTQAAMMFAERFGDLRNYAYIRGMDEDTFRDTVLSDLGLDKDGKKTYDLGGTTVEAILQDDLSFALFDTGAGKAVKSIPKKNADPDKYESVKEDFAKLKTGTKKIIKSQNNALFDAFLTERSYEAGIWKSVRLSNPLLNRVAQLLVWAQGSKTFTLAKDGAVNSTGAAYEITDEPITVAHPRDMKPEEIKAWQKYFTSRNLKQPFQQVWEPVINLSKVSKDRYKQCEIPYYCFLGQEKHGITVQDWDFHNTINIYFEDCDATVERLYFQRHSIERTDPFEIKRIKIEQKSRYANHIIAYLDKIVLSSEVASDNDSALAEGMLNACTVAQINDLLKLAIDSKATRCTALLLNYKNEHFPEFAEVEEFTLDW